MWLLKFFRDLILFDKSYRDLLVIWEFYLNLKYLNLIFFHFNLIVKINFSDSHIIICQYS